MLVLSFALLSVEFITVSKMGWRLEYDMYLFLIPCAYYLLKCALCLEGKLKSLETAKWGRASPSIQLTHIFYPYDFCGRILLFDTL